MKAPLKTPLAGLQSLRTEHARPAGRSGEIRPRHLRGREIRSPARGRGQARTPSQKYVCCRGGLPDCRVERGTLPSCIPPVRKGSGVLKRGRAVSPGRNDPMLQGGGRGIPGSIYREEPDHKETQSKLPCQRASCIAIRRLGILLP